jgi:hypothetical protein
LNFTPDAVALEVLCEAKKHVSGAFTFKRTLLHTKNFLSTPRLRELLTKPKKHAYGPQKGWAHKILN